MSFPVKFHLLGNTHRLSAPPSSYHEAIRTILAIYPDLASYRLILLHEGHELQFPIQGPIKFEVMVQEPFPTVVEKQPQKVPDPIPMKQLKLTVVEACNQIEAQPGETYNWKVTLENSGKFPWPQHSRLFLLGSDKSWPLAELAPGEQLTKNIELTAECFKLVQLRAGCGEKFFGCKICHQVVQGERKVKASGINCSESTWRKQKR